MSPNELFNKLVQNSKYIGETDPVTSLSLKALFTNAVARQNMVTAVKKRPVVVLKNNIEQIKPERKSSLALSSPSLDKHDTDIEDSLHSSNQQTVESKLGEKAIVGENQVDTTISQKVQEVIDLQPKNSGFNVRLDVVRKTIFRAMKKYYVTDFKNFFDYTQRKRKLDPEYEQEIFKQAEKYSAGILNNEDASLTANFIVALLDTKQKYLQTKGSFPELGNQINGLLRSFNTKKSKALLRYRQFAMLVLHFLNQNENIQELLKDKEQECRSTYLSQIELLREQAVASVSAQ